MRKIIFPALAMLCLTGAARAQDEVAPPPAAEPAAAPAPAPEAASAPAPAVADAGTGTTTYVSRGLTTSAGALKITLPIVLELSKGSALKPVWVPLDLRFGVTDQLEVFVNHSAPVGPIAGEGGVCLGGKDRGCDKFYNNLNLGAQFSVVKDAAIELAVIGALVVESLDPSRMAADVGVNFKFTAGQLAIKAAPQILIGLNKRDADNIKQVIFLPVQVAFQATNELAVFLDTGIDGPTEHFGDMYTVPLGVGAAFSVSGNLEVGAEFMLPSVISGVSGNKALDSRQLALFATYRTK